MSNSGGGDSSMMMVVMLGGVMSLCMSCVGGIGGFLLMDPTLGGLLVPPAAAVPGPTGSDPPVPGPSDDSSSGGGIVPKKPYYLMYGTTKWDNGSLLLKLNSCTDKPVITCYSPSNDALYQWIFEKPSSKSKTFMIRNKACVDKYLSFSDAWASAGVWSYTAEMRPKLTGADRARQEWYVKKGDNGITIANKMVNTSVNAKARFIGSNMNCWKGGMDGCFVTSQEKASFKANTSLAALAKNSTISSCQR